MFEFCDWWAGGGELTCVMIWRIYVGRRENKISRSDYSRSCDGNIISAEQAVGDQLACVSSFLQRKLKELRYSV